jgi:hypothetical protein
VKNLVSITPPDRRFRFGISVMRLIRTSQVPCMATVCNSLRTVPDSGSSGKPFSVHRLNHVDQPLGDDSAAKSPQNRRPGIGVCEPPPSTNIIFTIESAEAVDSQL